MIMMSTMMKMLSMKPIMIIPTRPLWLAAAGMLIIRTMIMLIMLIISIYHDHDDKDNHKGEYDDDSYAEDDPYEGHNQAFLLAPSGCPVLS